MNNFSQHEGGNVQPWKGNSIDNDDDYVIKPLLYLFLLHIQYPFACTSMSTIKWY